MPARLKDNEVLIYPDKNKISVSVIETAMEVASVLASLKDRTVTLTMTGFTDEQKEVVIYLINVSCGVSDIIQTDAQSGQLRFTSGADLSRLRHNIRNCAEVLNPTDDVKDNSDPQSEFNGKIITCRDMQGAEIIKEMAAIIAKAHGQVDCVFTGEAEREDGSVQAVVLWKRNALKIVRRAEGRVFSTLSAQIPM